jgi:hypothetical protein
VFFDQARQALAQARTVDEVKDIRDRAEALRLYTRQAGEGLEMQNWCAEIKLRAERRAGALLMEMEKHAGGHPNLFHAGTGCPPRLADLGIARTQAHRWQTIARLPAPDFEAHLAETKAKGQELTSVSLYTHARAVHKAAAREALMGGPRTLTAPGNARRGNLRRWAGPSRMPVSTSSSRTRRMGQSLCRATGRQG